MEFELVEEYLLHGEKRYRLRVKGTKLLVNVSADTLEEAMEKAARLLEKVKASRVLEKAMKPD